MATIAKCPHCNQFNVPALKANDTVCERCKPFEHELGVASELPDREMTVTKRVTVDNSQNDEGATDK
jgi:hypothetical protein